MTRLAQNLKFVVRLYRRSIGYTLVTLATLAIGVGINTAVFSTAYSLLFRPLPGITRSDGLVQVYRSREKKGGGTSYSNLVSYPNFLDYQKKTDVFSHLAVWRDVVVGLSSANKKAGVFQASAVSDDFFSGLGLEPAQGRFFLPAEDATLGSSPVAVISYGVWQTYFGADRNLLGAEVTLNGHPFVIVGVAPPSFKGLNTGKAVDLWVPITMLEQLSPDVKGWFGKRNFSLLSAFARLNPALDLKQAQAGADVLARQMREAYPNDNKEIGLYLLPHLGLELWTRNQITRLSLTLIATALLVLVVACINLANLTWAHTLKRQTEIGVRLALGASRFRLLTQLLTEGLLLSTVGGLLGLLVAFVVTRLLATFVLVRQSFPSLEFSLDFRVIVFALACAILSGLAFTVVPALRITRLELSQVTKERSLYFGNPRHRAGDLLIVLQVALVLTVLVASGLLLRTFRNYQMVDRGFDARNVLVVPFDLTLENYSQERGLAFVQQVLQRVGALPGMDGAAVSLITPISGDFLESRAQTSTTEPAYIDINVVTPEYFKTLNLPIERGRNFDAHDSPTGAPVAIVSSAAVGRLSLGDNPLGKALTLPDKPTGQSQVEIVGVAGDSKYRNLAETPRSVIYLPWSQNYQNQLTLVVRSFVPAKQLMNSIQTAINSLDKDFPVGVGRSLEEQIEDSLGEQSMTAGLVTSLGILSLVLSMIGLYGLLFYVVSQQKREIGIRMALGAQRVSIFQLVLWHGLKLTLIGTVAGALAATMIMRSLRSFLYGVKPEDPISIAAAAAILIAVAVAASYLPASRATKVDPAVSLRQQ